MKNRETLKKIFTIGLILVCALFILSSCMVGNRGIGFDSKQTFRYANVLWNGEYHTVKVKEWRDFEQSDSVQVTIDGNTFYTHLTNCVLAENLPSFGDKK